MGFMKKWFDEEIEDSLNPLEGGDLSADDWESEGHDLVDIWIWGERIYSRYFKVI